MEDGMEPGCGCYDEEVVLTRMMRNNPQLFSPARWTGVYGARRKVWVAERKKEREKDKRKKEREKRERVRNKKIRRRERKRERRNDQWKTED